MALKKVDRGGPLKTSGGLKKLDSGGIARQRMLNRALDFVPDMRDDVLADMPDGLDPEAEHAERMGRLDAAMNPPKQVKFDQTMSNAIKNEQRHYKLQNVSDYYFVAVFADGAAVSKFLQKLGYPDADATFVDGHVLASLLNIELPKPDYRLQQVRPPQKQFSRLVTAFPKKGG